MAKQVIYSEDARKKIKAGIDKVANAVRVTMGPKGRNVLLGKTYGGPTITNDGVSIAKDIELKDPFENLGAELIKQVAEKTNDVAGDGTTTATVITQALVSEGLKFVEAGINPVGIRHGMEAAKDQLIEQLKKNARPIATNSEVEQVATISAESSEMGKLIAEVMEEVGENGVVTVEQSQSVGLSKEVVQGMSFEKGYVSPYMMTDVSSQSAEIKDPFILITDKKVSSKNELLPTLEKIAQAGKKDIVIIAEDVDSEALALLIVNKLHGAINALAVKAPEFGDNRKAVLEDIAILTGAQVVSSDKGMKLENVEMSMLGRAAKVIATKDDTTIVGGKGKQKDINERIALIKTQADKTEGSYDREKLVKRMAKLSGGVAVIRVGAATETELAYMKLKMEDAVSATKAAVAEGIVAGGGVALVKAAKYVVEKNNAEVESAKKRGVRGNMPYQVQQEYQAGFLAVLNAVNAPLLRMIENAGKHASDRNSPAVVLNQIIADKRSNYGYNLVAEEFVDDMVEAGIIDPLKVTRTALENAVSVAALLLTTEAAVVDLPEEKKTPDMSGMGGGMGMPGMM